MIFVALRIGKDPQGSGLGLEAADMTIDLCLKMKPECELFSPDDSKMNRKGIDKIEKEVFSTLPPRPAPPSTTPLFPWVQALKKGLVALLD